MLVNEIKDSLFPQRDEEEEIGLEDASPSQAAENKAGRKKKKKKRVARTVNKPSVMPKIKEIRDGKPEDMCLNRI